MQATSENLGRVRLRTDRARFVTGDVHVGRPDLAAIWTMLAAYGYRVGRLPDWAGLLRDNPGATNGADHANTKRITLRCVNANVPR